MKAFRQSLIFLFALCSVGCFDSSKSLPGYIEGEYTYISSGVAGTLFNIYVQRGETVKKNDLLYALDPQPETANVEMTKANIVYQEAQVAFAKIRLTRESNLLKKNATSQEEYDQAQTDLESKLGLLAANRAQLTQSEWSLSQKTVYAPEAGFIFDTYYYVGEKVEANHPVLSLLVPKDIIVRFYVPEEKLSQIKLGQKISFDCDNCKGRTVATIDYISPEAEYTPPVIYSKDTRYKLVYLVRASMPENIAKNFHPGQPIDVYLHE